MGAGFQIGEKYMGHNMLAVFVRNNAPVSGFYNGACPKGALVLDMGGGVIYQNTGTLDATTFGALGAVLPAVINAAALPTADPHSTGSLWVNSAVVTVSAG